jgi:hypothetical protein
MEVAKPVVVPRLGEEEAARVVVAHLGVQEERTARFLSFPLEGRDNSPRVRGG